jgi:hypothetical protein
LRLGRRTDEHWRKTNAWPCGIGGSGHNQLWPGNLRGLRRLLQVRSCRETKNPIRKLCEEPCDERCQSAPSHERREVVNGHTTNDTHLLLLRVVALRSMQRAHSIASAAVDMGTQQIARLQLSIIVSSFCNEATSAICWRSQAYNNNNNNNRFDPCPVDSLSDGRPVAVPLTRGRA